MDYTSDFLKRREMEREQVRQCQLERCRRDLELMREMGVTRAAPEDIRMRARSADVSTEEMAQMYAQYGIEPMGGMERLLDGLNLVMASKMNTGRCSDIRRLLKKLEEKINRDAAQRVQLDNVYDFLAWQSGGKEQAQELAVRDTFRLQLLTRRLTDALEPEEHRSSVENMAAYLLDRCAQIFVWPYRGEYDRQLKVYTCEAYRRISMLDPMALETKRVAETLIREIQEYFGVDREEAVNRYRYLAFQRGARPYDEAVCLTMEGGTAHDAKRTRRSAAGSGRR